MVYLCIHAIFIFHRSTEERAQTAEEKALETQYLLKLAEEKIATLEKRLEMMGVDIEAEKKVEEQKVAKGEEDKVSNDETNLAKENWSEEGTDKDDNDQKKKSKSSAKSRKK